LVYVTVEDVERHFLRAKEAMAHVLWAPRDAPFGVREYCVEDPQGQQWVFAQQVRDVEPEPSATRGERFPVRAMLAEPVIPAGCRLSTTRRSVILGVDATAPSHRRVPSGRGVSAT
jgi:hypothetical protein